MDLNQIQQLKKDNEEYLNSSREAKRSRRSSVETVLPTFDGMRASMTPTTPNIRQIRRSRVENVQTPHAFGGLRPILLPPTTPTTPSKQYIQF